MKLVKVTDIFNIRYGNQLDLNKMEQIKNSSSGVNFISRTAKNNGVSAIVKEKNNVQLFPEGCLTVALGGSSLSTFLQPKNFYTGQNVAVLADKLKLSNNEKLYYCLALKANAFRYTTCGREANRTLANLLIPSKDEIPSWVYDVNIHEYDDLSLPYSKEKVPALNTLNWSWFKLEELFEIKKGKRLTKANMTAGKTPFIGSIDANNGYRENIGQKPIHTGNTITVNYNGSVAEAFYQPEAFWASDDVNVLYPKFEINSFIALFIVPLIKMEKYRFNYGRKWHVERMNISKIKLPITEKKEPDFEFMEKYIKSLSFSKQI